MPLDLGKDGMLLQIGVRAAESCLRVFVENKRDEGIHVSVLHVLWKIQ